MQKILTIAIVTTLLLSGCQTPSTRDTYDKINSEVNAAAAKPAAAGIAAGRPVAESASGAG
jgi:MSHA biogenesis protein MshL